MSACRVAVAAVCVALLSSATAVQIVGTTSAARGASTGALAAGKSGRDASVVRRLVANLSGRKRTDSTAARTNSVTSAAANAATGMSTKKWMTQNQYDVFKSGLVVDPTLEPLPLAFFRHQHVFKAMGINAGADNFMKINARQGEAALMDEVAKAAKAVAAPPMCFQPAVAAGAQAAGAAPAAAAAGAAAPAAGPAAFCVHDHVQDVMGRLSSVHFRAKWNNGKSPGGDEVMPFMCAELDADEPYGCLGGSNKKPNLASGHVINHKLGGGEKFVDWHPLNFFPQDSFNNVFTSAWTHAEHAMKRMSRLCKDTAQCYAEARISFQYETRKRIGSPPHVQPETNPYMPVGGQYSIRATGLALKKYIADLLPAIRDEEDLQALICDLQMRYIADEANATGQCAYSVSQEAAKAAKAAASSAKQTHQKRKRRTKAIGSKYKLSKKGQVVKKPNGVERTPEHSHFLALLNIAIAYEAKVNALPAASRAVRSDTQISADLAACDWNQPWRNRDADTIYNNPTFEPYAQDLAFYETAQQFVQATRLPAAMYPADDNVFGAYAAMPVLYYWAAGHFHTMWLWKHLCGQNPKCT